MNIVKLQDIKLAHRNPLHSYTLTMRNNVEDSREPPMFIAALLTIARTWKQPRCPSADEWKESRGTYTQWSITQPLKRIHLNQF